MSNPSQETKAVRESLGLSQEAFARRLMVSRNYISLIESGKKVPSLRLLLAIRELRATAAHKVTVTGGASSPSPAVNEDPATYGLPATRAACERYVREVFDEAAASGDPDAFPYIARTLKKVLPLGDFLVRHPARPADDEAARQRAIDAAKARLPRVTMPTTGHRSHRKSSAG